MERCGLRFTRSSIDLTDKSANVDVHCPRRFCTSAANPPSFLYSDTTWSQSSLAAPPNEGTGKIGRSKIGAVRPACRVKRPPPIKIIPSAARICSTRPITHESLLGGGNSKEIFLKLSGGNSSASKGVIGMTLCLPVTVFAPVTA